MADSLKQYLHKLAKSKELQKAARMQIDSGDIKIPKEMLLETSSDYVHVFQEILEECMNEYTMVHGTKLGDDYGFLSVEGFNASGNEFNISLTFDNGLNLSPSLNEDEYGSVILPRLLNTGFNADGVIYGVWKKHSSYDIVSSITTRGPMGFIEEAVERFNEEYGRGAFAEYIPQDAY